MRCIDGLVTEPLPDLPFPMRLHLRLAWAAYQVDGVAFTVTANPNVGW